MRIARKIMLLAFAAIAAMALAAGTASAQETEVEVWDEHANAACGFIATGGGCDIHLVGESHIVALPSGVRVSECQDEFEGVIQTDGTGEVEWIGIDDPGATVNCNTTNCAGQLPDEDDWELLRVGELGGEAEHIDVRLCLEAGAGGADLHCDFESDIADSNEQAHDYTLSMLQLCAGGARRWEATWTIESDVNHDEIEFVHHDDPC